MNERDICPWSNMNEEARMQYWASLALRHTRGIGQRTCTRLLNAYGSAYAALQNLPYWNDLGIPAEKGARVADGSWRGHARIEWENAQNLDAHILMWHEDAFPPRLKELSDAPTLLYLKGDISLLKVPALAIVGARNCTKDGLRVAGRFAREISDCGITVVSGMAYGIDQVAHTHALQGIGKSIGILGTGIDITYPVENAKTFADMIAHGLLISEFAPHSAPVASNFPVRNRIISGLSLGVLVIEASIRSGSLITARQALEQNREVYAVPGAMFSTSASGCQELIRQGARPVFCVEDIIRDLEMQLTPYNISTVQNDSNREINSTQIIIDPNNRLCPEELSDSLSGESLDFKNHKNARQQSTKHNSNSADLISGEDDSLNIVRNNMELFPQETVTKKTVSKETITTKGLHSKDKRHLPQGEAGLVVEFLSCRKSCHIDELSLAMNKSIAELNALLIRLEIEDWVNREPGARYSIVK